ncbi:sigma-70 family RNA polymerase sigma factor [Polystyrenella longa]|nr:sigma-70 family RNA polymerase sigma factor [Polystyrenella longa]
MNIPETRASLILRLSDKTDVEAWDEFVTIYQPLVYRLALKKGFQDADAHELVQEVHLAVSRAVDRWEPISGGPRFRDWLFQIARNLMINFMTRRKYKPWATGSPQIEALLNEHADPHGEESRLFDLEFRREVFQWAACQVEENVQPSTWQAFWMSSVEDIPIPEVAERLQMTVGAVYIARSRVIGRIRNHAHKYAEVNDRSNG